MNQYEDSTHDSDTGDPDTHTPRDSVESLEDLEPGVDRDDPYEDVSLESLPAWWQAAIDEFDTAELRSYQPSRLTDGSVLQTVTDEIASEYGVTVAVVGKNVEYGDRWQVLVDGTAVTTVDHIRSPAGYSRFEIDEKTLRSLVEDALD